jgi:hypothetical protein
MYIFCLGCFPDIFVLFSPLVIRTLPLNSQAMSHTKKKALGRTEQLL